MNAEATDWFIVSCVCYPLNWGAFITVIFFIRHKMEAILWYAYILDLKLMLDMLYCCWIPFPIWKIKLCIIASTDVIACGVAFSTAHLCWCLSYMAFTLIGAICVKEMGTQLSLAYKYYSTHPHKRFVLLSKRFLWRTHFVQYRVINCDQSVVCLRPRVLLYISIRYILLFGTQYVTDRSQCLTNAFHTCDIPWWNNTSWQWYKSKFDQHIAWCDW